MAKKKPLSDSPAYTDFIRSRDKVLEDILQKYQIGINHVVTVLKQRTLEMVALLSTKYHGKEYAKMTRDALSHRLEPMMRQAIAQTVSLMTQLRDTTYLLSYAGQTEAISIVLQKPLDHSVDKSDVETHRARDSVRGGSLQARVELAFNRLLRDVIDAFQLSQVLESPTDETLARIERAFPAERKIKKRAPMAKVQEAADDTPEAASLSFGYLDQDTWDKAVQDYTQKYLPFGRSPEDRVFYPVDYAEGQTDQVEGYSWELEQEVTNDFVESVRQGENDAANEADISDFEWNAIIDSKTDDCCSLRDGLLTSEIQKKLDAGDYMGDCDATNAPAHFNCRCRMVPATSEMENAPKPDNGADDFDSWLAQKANA